jgi:phospholipid:diacylglycerol acyltransferase
MHLAAYDWRLSFPDLERRDRYFSKLKSTIELAVRSEGKKAVAVAHSMGSFLHTPMLIQRCANALSWLL